MSVPQPDALSTAEVIDELGARRRANSGGTTPASGSPDSSSPCTYASLGEVLDAAEHLVDDLAATGEGTLLVGWDELEFVARRLRGQLRLVRTEAHRLDALAEAETEPR